MTASGSPELTWPNKHKRLVAAGTAGYEWVDPEDPRFTAVRCLDEVLVHRSAVGEASGVTGTVVEGDLLDVARALVLDPDLARDHVEQVRLIYLDPPFNTGQAFGTYDDDLEPAAWLSMVRDRIEALRPLLAGDGSIWVHLGDEEVHRCRCVMDELFGSENHVGTVVWEKKRKPSFLHGQMATVTDSIVVYARDRGALPPFTLGGSTPGKGIPFHNRGNPAAVLRFPAGSVRFGIVAGHVPAGDMSTATIRTSLLDDVEIVGGANVEAFRMEGEWRFGQAAVDRMAAEGEEIRISRSPFRPNLIRQGETAKKISNVFSHRVNGVPTNEEATAELLALDLPERFATPKPEGLLQRILEVATEPGDLVVDGFAGSGTTAAVAHKLGRRWLVCERAPQSVAGCIVPRLQRVVDGRDPGGISAQVGWTGGGSLRWWRVAPPPELSSRLR